jgi:predicted negative regulator of RcsB-dependent stress response
MIWIKRVLPFLLIAAGYFGYTYFQQRTVQEYEALADKYAFPVALAWVGSAKYRDQPRKYEHFRDSVLKAYDLDKAQLEEYFKLYDDQPADYDQFTQRVIYLVDSLSRVHNRFLQ